MRTGWLILWYAIVLHGVWGVMLLASDAPLMATPVAALGQFLGGRWTLAAGLFLAAGLAVVAMYMPMPRMWRVGLLLPQQFFMIISALGGASAILAGQYADGVQRDMLFIGADQVPAIIAAALHTLAVVKTQ